MNRLPSPHHRSSHGVVRSTQGGHLPSALQHLPQRRLPLVAEAHRPPLRTTPPIGRLNFMLISPHACGSPIALTFNLFVIRPSLCSSASKPRSRWDLRTQYHRVLLRSGGGPVARRVGQVTRVGGVCYGQANRCWQRHSYTSTWVEVREPLILIRVPDSS